MRILAGQFKGRNLLSPKGSRTTRPMTGLVKKSLFDTLSGDLPDAVVADLFCGTGTIGLEALSRGARFCVFADRDRSVIQRLRRNLEDLQVGDRSSVWAGDLFARLGGWLAGLDDRLDLAFVDPPYDAARSWDWPEVAGTLFLPLAGALADGGLVVLRCPRGVQPPPKIGPLVESRQKAYSGESLTFYHLQTPS